MKMNATQNAPVSDHAKRRPGRPRRAEEYSCVSVTISSELIRKVDELARQWGLNRSGAVSKLLSAEIDNSQVESPLELEFAIKRISEIVARHV